MKEKSSFVCPFCNGPIYIRRKMLKAIDEETVIKEPYCTCRGYKKMKRITEKCRKERLRYYLACKRLAAKADKIEERSKALIDYENPANYISFYLLGIKDSFDITKGL